MLVLFSSLGLCLENVLLAAVVTFATDWLCAKFNYSAGGLTGAASGFACVLQKEVVESCVGIGTGSVSDMVAGLLGASLAYNVIAALAEESTRSAARKASAKED